MITFEDVYTKARAAVLERYSSAYLTSMYEPIPSSFPAVSIRSVGRSTPAQNVSLNNTENVQEWTIEVQVCSNLKNAQKSEADSILSIIEQSMKSMFFVETSASPVDNADTNIYRLVARFRRIVADADEL